MTAADAEGKRAAVENIYDERTHVFCGRNGGARGMEKVFAEMITFQVKPDRLRDFEEMMIGLREEMAAREGCRGVRFFRRGYTFDGVEWGNAPREITRIVKCVKFFAYWEFDGADSCGKATGWLMKEKNGEISRMLIMPFEINSGYGM